MPNVAAVLGCTVDELLKGDKAMMDKIEKDIDRDNYMSAEEAVKYGIVDKVISKRK